MTDPKLPPARAAGFLIGRAGCLLAALAVAGLVVAFVIGLTR